MGTKELALDLLVEKIHSATEYREKSTDQLKEELPKMMNLYTERSGKNWFSISFGVLQVITYDLSKIMGLVSFKIAPRNGKVFYRVYKNHKYGVIDKSKREKFGYIICGWKSHKSLKNNN